MTVGYSTPASIFTTMASPREIVASLLVPIIVAIRAGFGYKDDLDAEVGANAQQIKTLRLPRLVEPCRGSRNIQAPGRRAPLGAGIAKGLQRDIERRLRNAVKTAPRAA